MNRRTALKLSALSSSLIAAPSLMSFTKSKQQSRDKAQNNTSGFLQFQMGDLDLLMLSDGYVPLPSIQPIVAPDTSASDVNLTMAEIFQKTKDVELGLNILLINKGDRKILIDTGIGSHFDSSGGWLPQSLEKAGIATDEITDIFITHAHRDHIGGILDQEGILIFKNATYYISQEEFDFWTGKNPDFSASKYQGDHQKSIAFSSTILRKIEDKIHFYQSGDVLFDCLKTELAAGHTPGHTIFSLFSKDQSLTHIVDIVHHQLLIEKPHWGIQFDVDFNKGIATRKKVLQKMAEQKDLLLSMHLPWPGMGHIIQTGDATFKWIPLAYSTPKRVSL
ncbi:MAG: MBL fold metallo-hydrolase [Crocinitomicaceae bacterium]|nr:MBL fold metallo-hydrolase [Crocinitomicaceae bacterium]|tara:strand:- start:2079 stop:3083 length:1005 start_codon:yes stop_codon:yes gene_type:complete